ncbi:tensin-4 [Cricetulus griseus]|nr:tensin-4 [Cricetulus griseus]
MSSSLLAGGHVVSLTTHEESRMALHPSPSPGLPALCPYYTTESWGTQPLMAPTPCKGTSNRFQQAQQAEATAHCLLQHPGEQASGTSQDMDSCIDFSLETLNQMILELDPTFQLLPSMTAGPQAEHASSIISRSRKEEPEALDIKYIEVTSTRSRCLNGPQRCSSPCVTPPFGSPRNGSLLFSRDMPRETRSSSESLIFSGNQGRGPSPHTPSSLSNSSSCRESRASGSPLATPPSWEKGLKAPQRGSRVSMLSASPTSDVSYVFGSHSQTLPAGPLTASPEGPVKDMQPTMKFVMDTSKYWFKPSITREQAIDLLRKEKPGAFVIRDSSSYRGSFGLALKVQEMPASAPNRPGSLSAFVCQHSIMALALPCKLTIPQKGCHTLYLSSVSVETLSGALAVQKAISIILERDVLPTPTMVHFKVTDQGITLTDVQRKVFFRRHYPLTTLRFCGMDPEQRKWQKYCKASRWGSHYVALAVLELAM